MTKQEIIDYMYKNHVQGDFKIEEMAEDFAQPDLQPTCNKLATDTISRQAAKDAIDMALDHIDHVPPWVYDKLLNALNDIPSAEKTQLSGEDATKDATSGLIRRQDVIDAVEFGITYAKAIDVNTGESKELFKEGNDALKKAVERLKELPSAEPERTCVNCGRTANNGGWYADGGTRCPIEEHYALPKDGYCHLWEKRNITDDDYPERRTDE